MDSLIEEVAHLDQLALAIKSGAVQKSDPEVQELENLEEREDWFELMTAIFQNGEEDQTFFTGARILMRVVRDRWQELNQTQQLDIRFFVLNQLHSLPPTLPVVVQLNETLVQIALREFPTSWPNFLSQVFQSTPPKFQLFGEFIAALKTAKISPEHLEEITESIVQNVPEILPVIFSNFPANYSNDALVELVPYITWDVAIPCGVEVLYQNPTEEGFTALCEMLTVHEIDAEILRTFFNSLVEKCSDFTKLLPVIQQYLEELESPESIDALNTTHHHLIEETDDFEYWEFFVLTIYEDFTNGNPDRFNIHETTFELLINKILTTMPRPPGVLFSLTTTKELPNELLLFEQMRATSVSILEMAPEEFVTAITEAFQSQVETFDITTFASLCWATSTIVFEEVIDESFAAEVLKLACAAVEATEQNPQAVSCLLYLGLSFTNETKINDEMFEAVAHIAVGSIENPDLEKLAVQTLLGLSKAYPTINSYLDAVNLFGTTDASFQADNFATAAEAVFVSSNQEQRMQLLEILMGRISVAHSSEMSFETVNEVRYCLCGLWGCARSDSACVSSVLLTLIPLLLDMNTGFLTQLRTALEENGEATTSLDHVKIILSCFRAQMQLMKETSPKDGAFLLEIFNELPTKMRMAEALSLSEAMLELDVPDALRMIRILVINPTISMEGELKAAGERLPLEFAIALPKLLRTITLKHIEAINCADIRVLIDLIGFPDQQVAKSTLLALTDFINHWGEHPEVNELMKCLLGEIIVTVISAACEPDHRFAFTELSKIASTLVQFSVAADCPVQIYEGVENSHGLAQAIATQLSSMFPLIPLSEVQQMCLEMVQETSDEAFEGIVVQLTSKSKRETADEIVRHLRVLRIKANMGIGLFDS